MYFNLTHNVLMVWNGSAWVSTLPGSSKTVTQSLYYHATAGQTLFPLTTNDLYGHNFTYNQTITEGTQVIVAGDRVEPSTFSINTATSVVTFHAAVNPAGTLVVFDILTHRANFPPASAWSTRSRSTGPRRRSVRSPSSLGEPR